jgi:hypothetical protein
MDLTKIPKRLTPKWVEKHTAEEVREAWNISRYPFDYAVCITNGSRTAECLTQHFNQCDIHLKLTEEIREIMPASYNYGHTNGMSKEDFSVFLKEHFLELLALRRKYAKFYKQPKMPKAEA